MTKSESSSGQKGAIHVAKMYYEQKFLKRAHFNNNTWLITLILVKPRAHNERTFAQMSAHFRSAYKHLCLPQFGSSRKL